MVQSGEIFRYQRLAALAQTWVIVGQRLLSAWVVLWESVGIERQQEDDAVAEIKEMEANADSSFDFRQRHQLIAQVCVHRSGQPSASMGAPQVRNKSAPTLSSSQW